MTPREETILRQRVDELAGTGGRTNRERRAVRAQNLAALLDLPDLQAKAPAGATPTASEYNALRADAQRLFTALRAIAAAIQGDAT